MLVGDFYTKNTISWIKKITSMNMKALFDNLNLKLGLLRYKITNENKVNDFGINSLLETSAARIYNVMYDKKLLNGNLIQQNFPGVDLVDKDNKLMIQVSATGTAEKIRHTLIQIKKHNLTEDYSELHFFFLGDIKTLSKKSKLAIEKLIPVNLTFNIETDIFDTSRIYEELYYEQNLTKTLEIIKILDEVIGIIPSDKISGFESIAVASSKNNTEAFHVVDYLLSKGINVYINSKKLYQEFIKQEHKLFDYLILTTSKTPIDHLKYTLVIIDEEYVNENKGFDKINCILLKNALKNNLGIQLLNFNNSMKTESIKNINFINSIPCTKNNVNVKIDSILKNFFKENKNIELTQLDITNELKKIYTTFKPKTLNSDKETGYYLLQFDMNGFNGLTIYFIILVEGYSLTNVKNHLNTNYKKIIRNRTTVLLRKDPLQKTNRRIDNIKNSLSIENVSYVSDFLYKETFSSFELEPLSLLSDFVDPLTRYQKQNISGTDAIVNWVTVSSSSSVAIISGQGGLGKTTLCKKIHDKLIDKPNNYHVIFINSAQLINEFLKVDFSNEYEYDIYNIYENSLKNNNSHTQIKLDQRSFEINYELGNILIIFDGIDELISTITDFTLKLFLKNVSKIEAGLGRGKIIINCRDTYIEDVLSFNEESSHNEIDVFKLLPFDKKLASDYFSKHFPPKKIETCINLLDEFIEHKEDHEFLYPPFVVEIVKLFVEKDIENQAGDYTFISEYLFEKNSNDLIVYKTCYREIIKKETYGFDLTVDKQVEFMSIVACKYNGIFKEDDFEVVLKQIGSKDRNTNIANGLKDHPFLIKIDGSYHFRFDFLNAFFKSIKIKSILSNPTIDGINEFIDLFSELLDYNSQISTNLLPQIKDELENFIIKAKILISHIKNLSIITSKKEKAISNIFILLCQCCNDDISIKKMMTNIFLDDFGHINNFYLLNLNKSMVLKLDFNDLFFSNSIIDDYDSFLICDFNDETFFDETCTINKVSNNFSKKVVITAKSDNFDSIIKGDNTLLKSLNQEEDYFEKKIFENKRTSLINFFKCFYNGNAFKSEKGKREIISNYKYMRSPADVNELISLLEQEGLIISKLETYEIVKEKKSKIAKFVSDGINFNEVNNVLLELKID
jgi:hypothetical protein